MYLYVIMLHVSENQDRLAYRKGRWESGGLREEYERRPLTERSVSGREPGRKSGSSSGGRDGRQKCTPGYRWGPGIRDHYLIHYISAGRGTYTVLDRTFQLQEGDAFLIYPGMAVSYQADMRRPWSYEWVGFAGTDARPILDMTDFSPESLVLTAPAYGKDLQKHLRRINQAFGNSFRESISMTGELYSLLALLVGGSSRDRTARGRDAETVRSAVQFIEQRYKARFLLRHSELTIGAIAVSVGYDNGLYFSKAFKKITGRTPSSYRQESSGI